MPYYKRLDSLLETQIINAHAKKTPVIEIVRDLGITDVTVYNVLKRNGIKTRYGSLVYPDKKLDYFDKIDSKDKAYFLGLFAADGAVKVKSPTNKGLALILEEKDADILRYHSKLILGCDAVRIADRKALKQDGTMARDARLIISGNNLAQKICDFGIGPRKSFNCDSKIEELNDGLFKAYLLGLFDGDGSISFSVRKRSKAVRREYYSVSISIVGSQTLMRKVQDRIKNILGIGLQISRKECEGGTLIYLRSCQQDDCLKLLNWMYSDGILCLTRKKNIYLRFKEYRERYRVYRQFVSRHPYISLDNRWKHPRWKAAVLVNGKKKYVGQYDTEEQARRAQEKFYQKLTK